MYRAPTGKKSDERARRTVREGSVYGDVGVSARKVEVDGAKAGAVGAVD
jgi:hypothetical protein